MNSEWTKFSDKQPPTATEAESLAYLTYPHYNVLPWYDGYFWEWSEIAEEMIKNKGITHWMALPKPPN